MKDEHFVATVSARLDPVLAPRGFPYQASHNQAAAAGDTGVHNRDSVLFHCDGEEPAKVMQRYPGWSARLRESYGPQEIICLDLWVEQDEQVRSWSLEIFEGDVAAAAGSAAMQHLDQLQSAPLDHWADQLARILDAYFTALENDRPQP